MLDKTWKPPTPPTSLPDGPARIRLAHNRQYALPAGGLRGWAITDLRVAHNDAAGSSTTHLPASEKPALGAALQALKSANSPLDEAARVFPEDGKHVFRLDEEAGRR